MVNTRELAWDMYFANVLGIQYHPANPVNGRLSIKECALVADMALAERDKRCLSSLPSPLPSLAA